MKFFRDERGSFSAARLYLFGALTYQAAFIPWYLVAFPAHEVLGVLLTFFAALDTPLIVWAAGPRIAQYLGPQIAGVVQGVAESAKSVAAKIRAERDPADGTQPAGKVPQVHGD